MATLSAVRTALAATLRENISGVEVYETVPGTPVLPCFIVEPSSMEYNRAMGRGSVTVSLDVTVCVGLSPLDEAQDDLDGYLATSGSSSIDSTIFNNRSLGLSNTDANCLGMGSYGPQQIGEREALTATVQVVVQTIGTASASTSGFSSGFSEGFG